MRPRLRYVFLAAVVLLLVVVAASPGVAQPPAAPTQAPPPPPGLLKIFLDCVNAWCDENYFRTEITFVSYVRDQRDADVHVLVTAQSTGSGGTEYTLALIGLGRYDKVNHTLRYASKSTDTDDDTRRGMAATLKLGLVRYVADTPAARDLQVVHRRAANPAGPSNGAADPWDSWVFRTSLRGGGSGEQATSSFNVGASFSADRVTDAWKINTSASGSYSQSDYTFPEGGSYRSISRNAGATGQVVKSIGTHWAAGGRAAGTSSTYLNQALKARVAPAIEYNVFPYSESTRRQLTINAATGVSLNRYIEETIYGKTSETLLDETVIVSLDLRQPWGSTSTAFQASTYLNDAGKNRLVLYDSVDVRVFKGFSISAWGSVSRIRDQLYLPKGEATNEEVLVRQRQLATSYDYYVSIGFTYRFGSIFNNVVNSRFDGVSNF